jgi:UDP-N-acetylmuramate dehydrogenase
MDFQENVALSQFTTFRIGGPARVFCRAGNVEELRQAVGYAQEHALPILVLGGGSNMVVSDAGFPGLVVKIELRGIQESREEESVRFQCAAGESWDGIVSRAVASGYWGIENLSHIPGNAGAFAVQNVGAYGQEASQVVDALTALDLADGSLKNFGPADCGFGYRKSIFNTRDKGRYVILEITLKLQLKSRPNLSYADVARYFTERQNQNPGLAEIRQAITKIRDRKFTTPDKIPNAGSFFKNFILDEARFAELEKKIRANFDQPILDRLLGYKARLTTSAGIKIPTAFVIEVCGLKGFRSGGVLVNETQPLVLLNFQGQATGRDVLSAIKLMRQRVHEKTGLELTPEPELIGFTPEEIARAFAL